MKFIEASLPLNAARFTWSPEGTGSAEASDLPDLIHHQVWPDAADRGFTIIAEKTGTMRTFVEAGHIMNGEEIGAWVYRSLDPKTGRMDRGANGLTIKIWND